MSFQTLSSSKRRTRPTVLLADDHRIVAEALCRLLEPTFEVLGFVTDGRRLIEQVAALRPDVVVVDPTMPRLGGIEAVRAVRRRALEVRVVMLSDHFGAAWVEEAFAAGVDAYVVKTDSAEDLVAAIRAVLAGQCWASEEVVRWMPVARSREGLDVASLSTRELEVARLVAEGLSNQAIATRLGIAEVTVRSHLGRSFGKLGARNRVELAVRVAMVRFGGSH